jgi:hypothetical protein
LLMTRHGEDINAHVRTMLHGLGSNPVVRNFSLRDIYAMVAAMHAENQLYLSRSVLAYALGCDPEELERSVLYQPWEVLTDAKLSVRRPCGSHRSVRS